MKIAIARPDYGVVGGFEIVLRRIEQELRERGHEVQWLLVDVSKASPSPFGVAVPSRVRDRAREFFLYLSLLDAFRRIDTSWADVLVSTQPPSFAARHRRHLSLFYHHHRVFYDLEDVYVASGFAERDLHAQAARGVRAAEAADLRAVGHFLVPSASVAERLRRFNDIGRLGPFHAGPGLDAVAKDGRGRRHPVCIGRLAWPKRPELFVHAMKYLPKEVGLVVGSGGRRARIEAVDAWLSQPGRQLDAVTDQDLWLSPDTVETPARRGRSNIRFVGGVSATELAKIYREALCVVTPAYLEDYGLTALEAMTFGTPVIACTDGGGLRDFVEDGTTGLLVEPRGRAIAEAIQRLREDPDLARRLAENGRSVAAEYTWARAMDQFLTGLGRVADSAVSPAGSGTLTPR